MHLLRLCCIVVYVIFLQCPGTTTLARVLRFPKTSGFLLYRTNSINQRPCTCSTTISCSCCELVTLLYICSNYMYQRNGLNVNISLNTEILKTTIVSIYRPFQLCSPVPGSLFSSICVNVLELNEFPRSLTVCVRHVIVSKSQEWQINYTCVSISTELPTMTSVNMSTLTTAVGSTASTNSAPSRQMSMVTSAMTAATSAMTKATSAMTKATSAMTMAMTMATSAMTAASSAMTASTSAMTTKQPVTTGSAQSSTSAQTASMSAGTSPVRPMSTNPSSMTAIVGERGKRRARYPDFYKSRIVNGNKERPLTFNDKLGSIYQRYSVDSMTTMTTSSGDTMINDRLLVLDESVPNVFQEITEYYPSRIPPLYAKKIEGKSSLRLDNGHVVFGSNETARLIFSN